MPGSFHWRAPFCLNLVGWGGSGWARELDLGSDYPGRKFCAGIPLFGGILPFGDVSGWLIWAWKYGIGWGRGIRRRGGIRGRIWERITLYEGVFCMKFGARRLLCEGGVWDGWV